ncbi:OprD family outer membrane porin [Maribacter sp. MAR_2009_72]|uniref:OprD family outer membrane porin n=1 Tax=Maribacter sp. MAR_2009_72 TaxID=1250050 RepID=UPI001199234F|nr:OprD family outer membrane porin [Maribacter sp. MAR_2009_72]TVZ14721.1 outer membrane OprD family porin [Maribacter sp. MAR_2009_72]
MRILLILIYCLPFFAMGQDTLSTKKGTFSGQWRTYYMRTANKGDLKNFNALATGGKLKYQYQFTDNLEVGAAIYNSTNIGLEDLTVPDDATGRISRYEEGLFDRLNLNNDAVFLLGELYAKYKLNQHAFTLGRMKINTPLINPEDGRMIPTLVQGLWYNYKIGKNTFQFGLLNEIAPRSTGQFYGIGESIGTYPVGRNKYGNASLYTDNTESDYILMFNSDFELAKNLRINVWNQYVENVFNSIYIKPSFKLSKSVQIAGEWLHQNKIGDGGNAIDSLRYFNQNTADVLGLKMSYTDKVRLVSLAYNRILPQGQFISPREWGREDLFSFQKRERSEGSADNHALVLNYKQEFKIFKEDLNLISILSIGKHWKPDVTNAILNKYAMPDYTHINLDIFFKIKKIKSLRPELLITSKMGNGDIPDNPNFYFNKVDLFHLDIILNYNF